MNSAKKIENLSQKKRKLEEKAAKLEQEIWDEREKQALPEGTFVKFNCGDKAYCQKGWSNYPASQPHVGVWKIDRYNPDADDYRLIRPDGYPRWTTNAGGFHGSFEEALDYSTYGHIDNLDVVTEEEAIEDAAAIRERLEEWKQKHPNDYHNNPAEHRNLWTGEEAA